MYRVFLVDDEEITLSQTAETVPWLDNGFTVIGTESDPFAAETAILRERPEVVFLDLRMPRMNGLELMRRIRGGGFRPEFVMLSAYSDFEDARTFFKQEGFDYLLKPVRMTEIELLLENLTRRLSVKYPADNTIDDNELSADESFAAMVEHIRKNFADHYTLEQLGKQFGLSRSYICALFAKHYNTSLSSFVAGLRMEEAKRRILESREPFKSIAVSCGYNDYYYFSKMFKGYFGMSPMNYRDTYGAEGTGETDESADRNTED